MYSGGRGRRTDARLKSAWKAGLGSAHQTGAVAEERRVGQT